MHVIKHGNAWKYCYMFTHVSVTEREKGKGLIIKLVSVNMKSFKICGTVYTGCNIDWLVYVHNCIYIWHYMRIICLSFLLRDSLVLATSRVIPGVQLPGLKIKYILISNSNKAVFATAMQRMKIFWS